LGSSIALLTSTKTHTGNRPQVAGGFFRLCTAGMLIVAMLIGGCSHIDEGALSQEASQFFNQGNYTAALNNYEQILANDPDAPDRILFEMGITYAYPTNVQKDYQKALNCFQKIIGDYPESDYRLDSQMMIMQIQNAILKDETIARQQAALDTSRQALQDKADEIGELQETIATLEDRLFALRAESVDKVLIEKQTRRLTLLAKGQVVKTYTIALGGNPVGPKERQGDCKTPEGSYIIDSRNGNSGYHLALHISYPNAEDKRRARELGVSPGGDIMIHGLKNGFAQVGASHTANDWTEGCIAVTNQEMEEIYRFVPVGTVVEIKP
jgi:tetratricopeptide (TPR) repeat protein